MNEVCYGWESRLHRSSSVISIHLSVVDMAVGVIHRLVVHHRLELRRVTVGLVGLEVAEQPVHPMGLAVAYPHTAVGWARKVVLVEHRDMLAVLLPVP